MKKALIMHGTMGSPEGNWIPWLKTKLKDLGVQVYTPTFPTPENQTVKNWINIMDETIGDYNEDTIIIGHSSAPLAICAKLQQLESPIQAVFLVAPFIGDIGVKDYDKANHDFSFYPFDWEKAKKGAKKFYIYRSDNDQYVPEETGRKLAGYLGVEETTISGGGHLSSETGYDKFEKLLVDIKNEITNTYIAIHP